MSVSSQIYTYNNVMHISSCVWRVLPRRTKSPLLCSVMRVGSAFIMQVMAICMSDVNVETDIFQTAFSYNTGAIPDMIIWSGISYHSLLPFMLVQSMLNIVVHAQDIVQSVLLPFLPEGADGLFQ